MTKRSDAKANKVADLSAKLEAFEEEYDEDQVSGSLLAQGYSPRNTMLIVMQRPSATQVHGYKDWIKLGRKVRPNAGEKGIAIFAPAGRAKKETDKDDEKTGRQFFRVAYVFDIRQTVKLEDEENEK